jgi:hypothetical protein
MLKKRINRWSLDKKRKEADMLVGLRIALEREAQGKKSIFLDRGRLVTFEDIKNYFKRKGIYDLHAIVGSPIGSASSALITCYTPPATPRALETNSPEPEDASDLGQLLHDGLIGESNMIDVTNSVPTSSRAINYAQAIRPLNTRPGQLEQLLTFNGSYYDSVFDNPKWKEEDSSFETKALELFYHSMYDGQAFLEAGYATIAFQKFDCAFNFVSDILRQRVLLLLPYIYHMMVQFGNLRNQEVISRLLDFVVQMTETCCSQSHPIKLAVSALGRMSPRYRAFSAARALQSTLDHMANKIEPLCQESPHWQTICPTTHHEVSDDLGGAYHRTAIALRNLIADVGAFNIAIVRVGHTSYTDRTSK